VLVIVVLNVRGLEAILEGFLRLVVARDLQLSLCGRFC